MESAMPEAEAEAVALPLRAREGAPAHDDLSTLEEGEDADDGAEVPPSLQYYFLQRYNIFSRYDEGIEMDANSLYGVTMERIARHHAERCRCEVIVDAFCGVGGNSIQFARTCSHVIAIDNVPERLRFLRHNAAVYDVADRIDCICGDVFDILPRLAGRVDVVFLSPPWGGPARRCPLLQQMQPYSVYATLNAALQTTANVAIYLPRQTSLEEYHKLGNGRAPMGRLEREVNVLNGRARSHTLYFGNLVRD